VSVWSTPQSLFDKLNAEFGFSIDVCADHDNKKVVPYLTREQGLSAPWRGKCWLNPPYGREISAWMKKAFEESLSGATVVALVPSRTNAPWWHDYVMRSDEIRFIRKKVPFVGSKRGVPFFGSVIVIFGAKRQKPIVSSWEQP